MRSVMFLKIAFRKIISNLFSAPHFDPICLQRTEVQLALGASDQESQTMTFRLHLQLRLQAVSS